MHPQVAAAQARARAEARAAAQNGGRLTVVPDARSAAAEPAGSGGAPTAAPHEDTPMGVLLGTAPHRTEPAARPDERQAVRVEARLVKLGRGTSLVVLPSWRAAIAVSVPTELLLEATGLDFEHLAAAELSVLIDPHALHDRELGLHGWRSGPLDGPTGRRTRRR